MRRWVRKKMGENTSKIYILITVILSYFAVPASQVSWRNLPEGLVVVAMWYRSHWLDRVSEWLPCSMQQRPMRTCFFYFGNSARRKWGSAGVLAQASPETVRHEEPCWGEGRSVTLGLSRAGRRMCSVLPGEAHGRFHCSLATFCGFLLLVFGRSECASCLFHQINVCILQPYGCCILVWCVGVFFGSWFNKDC